MPLKFPVRVNIPLSLVDGKLHELLFTVRTKLVVPSEPPAFTVSNVVKANIVLPELVRVAAQFPLMLPVACEFEPHPASIMLIVSKIAVASFFMGRLLRGSERA